jgi:hypothetical protein
VYLHLDIEYADASLLGDVVHCLDARAVVVVSKLRMLNEALLVHQLEELFLLDKVVLAAILLSASRPPCSVGDAEAELVWVLVEEALEDGGFAGAAGPTDDDGTVALDGRGVGCFGIGGRHVVWCGVGEGARGGLEATGSLRAKGAKGLQAVTQQALGPYRRQGAS